MSEVESIGESVYLHLYDLSQGWAAKLSPSLIGKQIEGIWHTGVVLRGREYFWGGELQILHQGRTPFGIPTKKIPLGTTHIPDELVIQYVEELRPQFNQQTYSLLSKNCNNFSNELALFLTGHGIPPEIVGLPEELLNTPIGSAIKPLLLRIEEQTRAINGQIMQSPSLPQSPQPPAQSPIPLSTNFQQQPPKKTPKYIQKGALPLISTQGLSRPFFAKIRSLKKWPEETISILETALSTNNSSFVLQKAIIIQIIEALNSWGYEECAPLLFILRSLVLIRVDVINYFLSEENSEDFKRLVFGLKRCILSEQKNCSLLALTTTANFFGSEKGTDLMMNEIMLFNSIISPALSKLIESDDSTTRHLSVSLIHNYSCLSFKNEVCLKVGNTLIDGLAKALLALHPQEQLSEEVEFRLMESLGILLLNNESLVEYASKNADLYALLIARESEETVPRISQTANELLSIIGSNKETN